MMILYLFCAILCDKFSSDDCIIPPCSSQCCFIKTFEDLTPLSTNVTWEFFSVPGYVANDGVLNNGVLNSNPFTLTIGPNGYGVLDHYKYFSYKRDNVVIPQYGAFHLNVTMTAQTFNTQNNPFPEQIVQINDLRFAAGVMTVIDWSTGVCFSFALTNDRVYALYERLPIAKNQFGQIVVKKNPLDYYGLFFSFSYAVPLKKRERTDIHRLAITVDNDSRSVIYSVDGKDLLTIPFIAFPINQLFMTRDLGGPSQNAFPVSVTYAFGTMDFLDFYPACKRLLSEVWQMCEFPRLEQALVLLSNSTAPPLYNPITGPTLNVTYYDNQSNFTNRLWGQGVQADYLSWKVYTKLCKSKRRSGKCEK